MIVVDLDVVVDVLLHVQLIVLQHVKDVMHHLVQVLTK